MIRHFKITLLSPLFYYTKAESGVASTTPFIGDLALIYATNFALSQNNDITYQTKSKPDYEEIKNLGFLWTIARPLKVKRTQVYARYTSPISDGMVRKDLIELMGKALFKNYFHVQGIEVGSMFQASFIGELNLPNKFTLRIGNGRDCLILLEEINEPEKDVWVNYYTITKIFNKTFKLKEGFTIEPVLAQYIIVKGLNREDLKKLEEIIL
ncbi:type I-D CRISPR-associated protein Cas5/Csc1 [Archaeoglobales archaeon]|mgnify:CR=1 FL=1|nr:MAG: type I-D CRISPR-associated protein Cas5/Csc1 [Archaeoglobales archaeon]